MNRSVPLPSLRGRVLLSTIASLLALPKIFAADAVITSGAFTGDADSGVSGSKIYTAIANVIGGDVSVNGATFIGSGNALSGAGWQLTGLNDPFGGGGNHTTTFGGSTIDDLFDGFQYGGRPGTLTLSGLTVGQTYVATLYQQAWSLGDNRTNNFLSAEGATAAYNSDALEASMLRYTFVATGETTTLSFRETRPNYSVHFYGLSNEQVFTNTWTPATGGDWNTGTNWSSGAAPTTIGSNASFGAQAGPTTVTLGGPTTVGHIEFKGTGSYTISGIDPLTLQADAGAASVIKTDAGSTHTISAPVVLNSDLGKFGAGTLALNGGVSGAKGISVGSGTVRFGAANSYTGGTSVSAGATLDLNGISQVLNTLSGAGLVVNNGGGAIGVTVDGGAFTGLIKDHDTGVGTIGLVKNSPATLTFSVPQNYSGPTTVNAGTVKLQAGSNALITDNFQSFGNPDTNNLNFNLASRQTGSAALLNWTPSGNTQTGNPTAVGQPPGTEGEYLLLAYGGSATLNDLPLSTTNVPGPVKIAFDMFRGSVPNGDTTEWTSFTLRSAGGNGGPVTGSGEFGFLYRQNSGIQMFSNGGAIQDIGSTTGGNSFGFYLADAAGTGSPFAGNGTRVVVTQGGNVIGSHLLSASMAASFLTFGSAGAMIGGVDNLAVNPFQTNTLVPTSEVSLTTAGATLQLDAVHQTVTSLSGVAGTAINLGPFSRLTVNGTTSTTFNGSINGALGSFVKAGTNTLELGGASTHTGGTTIASGTILAHNSAALGAGEVSIAAGANYLAWFNTGSPAIANNFTLNGLGGNAGDGLKAAIYADGGGGGYGTYALTGTVTLAATSDIAGHNINNLLINGKVTGPGGLVKGSGRGDENSTLILNNPANDFAGGTVIRNGTLKLGAAEVIPHGVGKGGVTVNAGTTLDLAGNNETINSLSGSGTVTASPGVGIAAPVFFTDDAGTGISATKTYSHALDFAEGAPVTINGVEFTGAGLTGANWNLTGAVLTAGDGNTQASGDVSRLLTNFFYNGNPATLTLNGLTPGTSYEMHVYQRQWGGDRTQMFSFNSGAASGQLIYNEDASATPSYLSFRYTADASGTATLTTQQVGGGTFHWFGVSNEVVAAGPIPTLTVGDETTSLFSGNITSGLALTKQGSGKLTLSAVNSYTGATTVTAGTLVITGSLDGTASVAVTGGTLAGTGTINPVASVAVGLGGVIAPGDAGLGTLSMGPLSFVTDAVLSIEVGATTNDTVAVTGALTLNGTVKLELSLLADPADNTTFTLVDGTAALAGYESGGRFSLGLNVLENGEIFTVTSGVFTQDFQISYTADGGRDVALLAVPEPGSAALLLLGGAALAWRRRRS